MSVYIHLKSNTKFRAVFFTVYFYKRLINPFFNNSSSKLNVIYTEESKAVSGLKLTIYWGWQTYNKNINKCIITDYKCLKENGNCERITAEI